MKKYIEVTRIFQLNSSSPIYRSKISYTKVSLTPKVLRASLIKIAFKKPLLKAR
jgi:hypothetical protein